MMISSGCAGWNTNSLTAQDEPASIAAKASNRAGPQSKIDMFSVLQLRNPQNQPDAWFGHAAIDPSAGKKSVAPPPDPKGRKGLFQVEFKTIGWSNRCITSQRHSMMFLSLHLSVWTGMFPSAMMPVIQVLSQVEAAAPSSDSWLGNTLIDPSLGKRSCERPDKRLGRPNLFPLMQQVRTLSQAARWHFNVAICMTEIQLVTAISSDLCKSLHLMPTVDSLGETKWKES
jgi:hypothetical protein